MRASPKTKRRVGPLLLAVASLFTLEVPGLAAARSDKPPLANPLQAQSPATLTATDARPLFVPSRRQPPQAPPPIVQPMPVVQAAPPPPPPNVTLIGVLRSDRNISAFIRSVATGKLLLLRAGDDVEGWKVTAIGDRQLALSHDKQETSITLFKAMNAQPMKRAMPVAYPASDPPSVAPIDPAGLHPHMSNRHAQ